MVGENKLLTIVRTTDMWLSVMPLAAARCIQSLTGVDLVGETTDDSVVLFTIAHAVIAWVASRLSQKEQSRRGFAPNARQSYRIASASRSSTGPVVALRGSARNSSNHPSATYVSSLRFRASVRSHAAPFARVNLDFPTSEIIRCPRTVRPMCCLQALPFWKFCKFRSTGI